MADIKIYIAYATRAGKDIPGSLIDFLRSKGFDVWWEEDLEFGIPWFEELTQQIRTRDVLIAVINGNAQESQWLGRKIDMARGLGLAIIPIVVNGAYDHVGDKLFLKDYPIVYYSGEGWDNLNRLIPGIERSVEHSRQFRASKGRSADDLIANSAFGSPITDKRFVCDIFMIMPFKEELDPIYREHVKPIVAELNLSIKRGDDPFSRHEIIYEIWSLIHNCHFVIAECTGRNPNVFYELGIAHTLGKPVIMITQNIKDVPFDVRGKRSISYKYTPPGMQSFSSDLKRAIQSILEEQSESSC